MDRTRTSSHVKAEGLRPDIVALANDYTAGHVVAGAS